MYKVDIENKILIELGKAKFSDLGLKEHFDIQEWIEKTPSILGEESTLPKKSTLTDSTFPLVDKRNKTIKFFLKHDDGLATRIV